MAYKYEIKTFGDEKFYQNGVTFATQQEADQAGKAKYNAWSMAETYQVVKTDETPNYRWVDGTGLVEIPQTPLPAHIQERMRYVEVPRG